MYKHTTKVLSILTVFVVALSILCIPVFAQEIQSGKNQTFWTEITGPFERGDEIRFIRVLDPVFKDGTNTFSHYEPKPWAKINGINYQPVNGSMVFYKEDVDKLNDACNKEIKQGLIDVSSTDRMQDAFHMMKEDNDQTIYLELPAGLYLIQLISVDKTKICEPAVLGVNIDQEQTKLDMYENFINREGQKAQIKAAKRGARKRVKEEGEDDYRKYCFARVNEELTFSIDYLYVPDYSAERQNITWMLEDRFEKGVFELLDVENNMILYRHKNNVIEPDEIKEENKVKIDKYIEVEDIQSLNAKDMMEDKSLTYLLYNKNQGFTLLLGSKARQLCADQCVTLVYQAKFADPKQAVIVKQSAYNANKVTARITKEKLDEEQVFEDEALVYSYTLAIWKTDPEIKGGFEIRGLNGAKFAMYHSLPNRKSEPDYTSKDKTIVESVSVTKGSSTEVAGMANVGGLTMNLVDKESDLSNFDHLKQLDEGKGVNYIQELEAPEHYRKDPTIYKVLLNGYKEEDHTMTYKMEIYAIDNLSSDGAVFKESSSNLSSTSISMWPFYNSKKAFLPSTGSNTMMVLIIIGIALMSGVTLVSRKKKHASSMN